MYRRHLAKTLQYVSTKFPVVCVTGPRQSGKTTLVKQVFQEKVYVTLEDMDTREFAAQDPRGFLNTYPDGLIIDEVQYVPELLSYMQTRVDESQLCGQYIITGSQHLLLSEKVSQSLAGRVALCELLPCSSSEIDFSEQGSCWDLVWQGLYPMVHARQIDPSIYYKSYVNTYIERDLRQITLVKDLAKFRMFLQLCAGRVGQMINYASLGADCGIDQKTLRAWLSILEESYIIFLLRPYHENFNKRLVKSPKLYFYDTGLASYLLGIDSPQDAKLHFARGALFENFVALELIKARLNQGKQAHIYFWRESNGHEVDFLLEQSSVLIPIEVKSAATMHESLTKELRFWQNMSQTPHGYIVYDGHLLQRRGTFDVLPWRHLPEICAYRPPRQSESH